MSETPEFKMQTENNIEKLQQKINEQEKLIVKQQKKIKHLSRSNEYLKNNEYIKFKNELAMRDMIQYLEVIINYLEIDNIEYKIYGDFFERLFTNTLVTGSNINIYVNYNRIERLENLCNIFFSLKKINNKDDYNMLKYFVNDQGIKINYYKLDLIVDSICLVSFIIHDSAPLYKFTTTSQNICITDSGIESYELKGNNNFYSSKNSLNVLFNLFYLRNKETNLIFDKDNKKILDNPDLLRVLSAQQNYERQSYKILNKFNYVIKDCPVCLENYKKCYKFSCNHDLCLDCLIHHVENNNYENKNCPLCRAELNLL